MFGKKKTVKKKNKRAAKKVRHPAKRGGIGWGKIVSGLFAAALMSIGIFAAGNLFSSANIFKIKSVRFTVEKGRAPIDRGRLAKLVSGRNIFACDIEEYARDIIRKYPSCESVNVIKVFPDSLDVHIRGRVPALQVHLEGRYYLVDAGGVVVDGPVLFAGREIISVDGVDREIASYIGRKYPSYKLEKALEVTQALRQTGLADRLNITGLNVEDLKNVVINIEGGIEVRIGNTDFKKRLELLAEASQKISLNPEKVRYVDLRFENLIIGSRQSG